MGLSSSGQWGYQVCFGPKQGSLYNKHACVTFITRQCEKDGEK